MFWKSHMWIPCTPKFLKPHHLMSWNSTRLSLPLVRTVDGATWVGFCPLVLGLGRIQTSRPKSSPQGLGQKRKKTKAHTSLHVNALLPRQARHLFLPCKKHKEGSGDEMIGDKGFAFSSYILSGQLSGLGLSSVLLGEQPKLVPAF